MRPQLNDETFERLKELMAKKRDAQEDREFVALRNTYGENWYEAHLARKASRNFYERAKLDWNGAPAVIGSVHPVNIASQAMTDIATRDETIQDRDKEIGLLVRELSSLVRRIERDERIEMRHLAGARSLIKKHAQLPEGEQT